MKRVVSFSREQRKIAKEKGLSLIGVSVPGCEFTGPVPKETAQNLLIWLTENVFKAKAKKT